MSVEKLPLSTSYNSEQALNAALQRDLDDVVIIGYYDDGEVFIASSRMTRAAALWLIKHAERHCLDIESDDI